MSEFFRKRVETTIEHMIQLLDEMDGDSDMEPELLEEQHDLEATSPDISFAVVMYAREKHLRRR